MMLRKLLTIGALSLGALAVPATAAFASTSYNQPGQPGGYNVNTDNSQCGPVGHPYTQTDSDVVNNLPVLGGDKNKGCDCKEVAITFAFAPSKGNPEGTWLLEVSGPPLHNYETLTYKGETWTVKDWEAFGKGTLGNHKPYFTLVKGSITLKGGFWENPQTAWLTGGYGEQCQPCVPVTSWQPPCDPTTSTWTTGYTTPPCNHQSHQPTDPCQGSGNKHGKHGTVVQ